MSLCYPYCSQNVTCCQMVINMTDDYHRFCDILESMLHWTDNEIRNKRKISPSFDKLNVLMYKFLQVDKIRAKAIERNRIHDHKKNAAIRTRERKDLRKSLGLDLTELTPKFGCYRCHHKIMEASTHKYLCIPCNKVNSWYLSVPLELAGKFAIVTGGRVKVGFHIALRLLYEGATVLVTSRFPGDTLSRYKAQANYESFCDRLHIVGADFRSMPLLEQFVSRVIDLTDNVHILVNNAAQTLRRPAKFYEHLIEGEREYAALQGCSDRLALLSGGSQKMGDIVPSGYLPPSVVMNTQAQGQLEQYRDEDFPLGARDIDGQQLDLRTENSWTQHIEEVNMIECVETQLINSIAPFYIIQRMAQAKLFKSSYIINVTSAEGRSDTKLPQHPHNNMSKGALNMLTHTISSEFLSQYDTIVVGVDTGWANCMIGPTIMAKLTYEDSAARAIQPVADKDRSYAGKQLRNFEVVPW